MKTTIEKRPLQELSVEEILRRSFHLYEVKFIQFFLPFIIVASVDTAFSSLVNIYIRLTQPLTLATLTQYLAGLVTIFILSSVVTWVSSTIANAIVVKYSSDLFEKGDAKLQAILYFTLSRLISLLGAGIATGILIILGLICLIAPGIILAIMFSLVVPVIVIEQIGALDSLGRSKRLVNERWGKTFVLLFIINIAIIFLGWVVSSITSPFGLIGTLVSNVITALIRPISPIAITFLYYSMIAKEAKLAAPSPLQSSYPLPQFAPQTKKYCISCGGEMPGDAVYCPRCGQKQVA